MLMRGNVAPPQPFTALLGRPPHSVEHFVPSTQRRTLRESAVLGLTVPLLRWSLAAVWIWTGVVSAGLYPVEDSLALLARVGAHGVLAWVLLYGAALLDLALGLATLWLAQRWRPLLWLSQFVLIAAYTLIISLRLPEFWLHPYGPVLKNLPMLAVIALLFLLDDARGTPPAAVRN
jgi:hypothetical protein